MNWLSELSAAHPIPHAILVIALVATFGLGLGSLRIRGFGLGVAGVLFAGIGFGHCHFSVEHNILEFLRDFGLVIFVYTIGLQVGPGFLTSLRKQGLPLNLLAAFVVLMGAGVTIAICKLGKLDMAVAVGLFSGATTNTPSLGAAQEALKTLADTTGDPGRMELPALGYAVAYPLGIIGIIFTMAFLRSLFRIRPEREAADFQAEQQLGVEHLERLSLEVSNANLNGLMLRELPGKRELGIIVSRIQYLGEAEVATAHGESVVHCGDRLLAVGSIEALEKFRLIVGEECPQDLMKAPGKVTFRRVVVTRPEVLGKSVRELGLNHLYGITVTRVVRAGVEMTAVPGLRLQFGDLLQVVGDEVAINRVGEVLGNSLKALGHTNFVTIFIGIALGILVGSYPFHIAGLPMAVKLGVAGGPLIVAIVLSRLGRIGPLVWYLPANANLILRELGIILFLACVGIKAGEHFLEIVLRGDGLAWMGYASLITLVPLLLAGAFARCVLKMNFMNVCGMLAGSMTDPPALAFANSSGGSDAPSVAYATVYPLTMLLRILVAQILVLVFAR